MKTSLVLLTLLTGCATQQPGLKPELDALKAKQEQQEKVLVKVKQDNDIMSVFLRRFIEVNPQAQSVVTDLGWKQLPPMELPKKAEVTTPAGEPKKEGEAK